MSTRATGGVSRQRARKIFYPDKITAFMPGVMNHALHVSGHRPQGGLLKLLIVSETMANQAQNDSLTNRLKTQSLSVQEKYLAQSVDAKKRGESLTFNLNPDMKNDDADEEEEDDDTTLTKLDGLSDDDDDDDDDADHIDWQDDAVPLTAAAAAVTM